jgi:hypothetical protein
VEKKNIFLGGDFNFMEDRVTERKTLVKNWKALYRFNALSNFFRTILSLLVLEIY